MKYTDKLITLFLTTILFLSACGSAGASAVHNSPAGTTADSSLAAATSCQPQSEASSAAASTNDAFTQRVQAAMSTVTKDPVYITCTNDYDRNGQPEAFVVTVAAQDAQTEEDTDFCTGNLYFVAADLTVMNLEKDIPIEYDKSSPDPAYYHILHYSDQDLFAFDEYAGTDIRSVIYSVSGNKAVSAIDKNLYIGLQSADNEKEILASVTDFDSSVDEDGLGTGRTEKTYWFYYKAGKIQEYKGSKMSLADLKKISGASEIIDSSCKDGWKVQNILYRENGIININYRHTYSSGAYDCMYDTLRVIRNAQQQITGVKKDETEGADDHSGEYKASV